MKRRAFIKSTALLTACAARNAPAKTIDRPNILWLTCEDNNIIAPARNYCDAA